MTFPAFIGSIGRIGASITESICERDPGWNTVCNLANPQMTLWGRNASGECSCWSDPVRSPASGPFVFVWGQPLVASDTEFNSDTNVEHIERADLPLKIWRLYQRHGTGAFAFLEGNFSLVLADPASQIVFLAVDKFGCEDICIRKRPCGLTFASQASLLTDSSTRIDSVAAAFFLAQEGFVPSPFTIYDSVETVGRAQFLRVHEIGSTITLQKKRYWDFSCSSAKGPRRSAVESFGPLLDDVLECRMRQRNGILLSGGLDSALLANLMMRKGANDVIAVTGAVRGHTDSEADMERAKRLSAEIGLRHEPVWIRPADYNLPLEWNKCCESWAAGTRITAPFFERLAQRLKVLLGNGCGAFSGQMADTLADNNYTSWSLGYTLRRMFFSPWFLRLMPLLRKIVPQPNTSLARLSVHAANAFAGRRAANMMTSILDGMRGTQPFYSGRVFGFGEMPGLSASNFPALSEGGFQRVSDWYASHFVAPIVSRLRPVTFYADMMELSMDMCMLHLDTRLVLHILRLSGGHAELPFLDSRVAHFFATLSYSVRAFYRKPKCVIRKQFKRLQMPEPASATSSAETNAHRRRSASVSVEQLLLTGSLGIYFRELLKDLSALDCAPGILDFLDESYVERQLAAFLREQSCVDWKFISRLAALEIWARGLRRHSSSVRHVAVSV